MSFNGEIINAYTDYEAGQAKKNGNAFNKPLFDGGPSARVVTQVAGTIVLTACGQPWAAWALNSAFSAMDVANGDLEMKHALVQMGVSAATSGVASGLAGTAYSAASPYASQAVTMAASGIDYEEGGGIGWSGDNFKAGIKRGMVNMAITATGNSFNKGMNGTGYERVGAGLNSGVSSFVNSGLDVDNGSWWRIGWKEEGTMDHVMAGLASATASAATYSKTGQNPSKNTKGETTYDKYNYDGDFSQEGYNSKLLYNTINSGMMSLYNMAAHDLSWEDASKQNGFYSGMLYDHKDVGGRLGKFVASGFDPDFDRKQSVPQDDNNKNPNNEAETLLGGLWQGLKQIGDDAADIGSAVTNGFAGNGLISDKEIARVQRESLAKARSEYAGYQNYMAAQNLQLSDIADAVNAANNGGARGDANANMSKLLTALNNKFGLEGEDRITSAEDMQAVISSGRVNVNDVMTVALESSNNNATFANVYGVAGGVRSGSLVADDNGFYTKGGQMVAGRYVEPEPELLKLPENMVIGGNYQNIENSYRLWEHYGSCDTALTTSGALFGTIAESMDLIGNGNFMSNGRLYTQNLSGRMFQGNQYVKQIVSTKTIGNIGKIGGFAVTAGTIGMDLSQYIGRNMTGERFLFNTAGNAGAFALGFTPIGLAAIPAAYLFSEYKDELYTTYLNGRYNNEVNTNSLNPIYTREENQEYWEHLYSHAKHEVEFEIKSDYFADKFSEAERADKNSQYYKYGMSNLYESEQKYGSSTDYWLYRSKYKSTPQELKDYYNKVGEDNLQWTNDFFGFDWGTNKKKK